MFENFQWYNGSMKEVPYEAPDFALEGVDGKTHKLADYKGKWLVLYFYPKDDTPGCTTEACSFRDARDDLTKLGAEVVGISKDEPNSHEKFKTKYNLDFMLLSDPEGKTINEYGAWGKKMFGREGILRKTFIIDPDGMVQKVYGRATPLGHGEQVRDELKKRQATNPL